MEIVTSYNTHSTRGTFRTDASLWNDCLGFLRQLGQRYIQRSRQIKCKWCSKRNSVFFLSIYRHCCSAFMSNFFPFHFCWISLIYSRCNNKSARSLPKWKSWAVVFFCHFFPFSLPPHSSISAKDFSFRFCCLNAFWMFVGRYFIWKHCSCSFTSFFFLLLYSLAFTLVCYFHFISEAFVT